jgi:hypothetical protein
VRQALAIFLQVLFSFSLISPAVSADFAAKLPVCCRRDGKHRCAMTNMADQQESPSSGLALRAGQPRCPNYPTTGAAPTQSKTVLLKRFEAISAHIPSDRAIQEQMETHLHHSLNCSHQKRGPPILHT